MSLGENIRYRRTVMGLTQEELAVKIGISPSQLSLFERGKRRPDEDTLSWIAEALGCRTEELFEQLAASRRMGRRISSLRMRRGLSQQVLADLVGVTMSTVQHWEYGYSRPLPKRLSMLADALDCRVEDLIQEQKG